MKKTIKLQKIHTVEIEIDDEELEGLTDEEINQEFVNKAEEEAYEIDYELKCDYGSDWDAFILEETDQ